MKMIIWNGESPNLCEIVVVDWKDGLVRKTSGNQVDMFTHPGEYTFDFSSVIDLSDLNGLSYWLGNFCLQSLSKLHDLGNLHELTQLDQLKELDEL